jgi:DNA-binding CsgD family transcriptional regulator
MRKNKKQLNTPSSHYQHKIVELQVQPHKLLNYSTAAGIGELLELNNTDPIIDGYKTQLLREIMILIHTKITEHQKTILLLTFDGYTQTEIANILGITQSAVCKAIVGNDDQYRRVKKYGGAINKLKKLSSNSIPIQLILHNINNHKRSIEGSDPLEFTFVPKPTKKPSIPRPKYKKDSSGKTCWRCKKYRVYSKFDHDITKPGDRAGICKECRKKVAILKEE